MEEKKDLIIEDETKASKAVNIIASVITYLIVILCLFVSIYSLTSKASGGLPSFGDHYILNVQTESMTGTIDKGDIIIVDKVTFDDNGDPSVPFVENETVVTFKADIDQDGNLDVITHLYIGRSGSLFRFRGTYVKDGNTIDDLQVQTVTKANILGVYNGAKVSGVGTFVNFLQSGIGFFICFILPIFLFVCYKGYKLIVTIMEVKRENAVETGKMTEEEKERERERIRQEILLEMQAQEASKKTDADSEEK